MKFRTEINLNKNKIAIGLNSKLLMLGSCFSNNIGKCFEESCLDVCINPFGVLYNPISIANNLQILIENKYLSEDDLFFHNGQYHSFRFHSNFSGNSPRQALEKMNASIENGHQFLRKATHLFITFGSSYVYESIHSKSIVANCHKLPASSFNRYRISLLEMEASWKILLSHIADKYPNLEIVFTVSPIRHIADGLHENQISKAQLLLLADNLCLHYPKINYFPAYEIMMDDLRDYRFYSEDFVHPNNVAIEYIWEILSSNCFDKKCLEILAKVKKIEKAANHKPFNFQSSDYKHFLEQSLVELNLFYQKYPYLRVDKLQKIFMTKLKALD